VTAQDLLSATGITKRFGGVQALSGVDFSIRQGEIYGLIGRTARARRRCSTC
jgi:branched-chain amino acid transport system ATP-binding protein